MLVVADGKPNCALVMSYLVANKRRREMNRFFEKIQHFVDARSKREVLVFFNLND